MFLSNFKYSLKTLFKNKILLFWTFIFPIIMGSLFKMAFSNIESSETLNIIDIAIVDNELSSNKTFIDAIEELSKPGDNQLFNISYLSLEEAQKNLSSSDITGYIELNNGTTNITVKESGINETILKHVVDEINSNLEMVTSISSAKIAENLNSGHRDINYEQIINETKELVLSSTANIENISNANLSYTMIEYYTLIAMTCLYGGILSMFIINLRLPNMKSVGKRISIAPIKKGSMLFGSLLASFIAQLIGLLILFLFTIFVLKVDYGTHFYHVFILSLAGSLAGLSLGVCIGSTFKTNENAKIGILIAFTMLCSYFSGMMGITMKYIVDKNIPILNMINPANMITDGLYSLYYYDTFNRYYFNLASLLIFSGIMFLISLTSLRRQKYDSI